MTISFCTTRHGASAASRSVPARPTFRQSARQSATASRGRGCSGAGIRTAVRSGSRPYPALQSPKAAIRRTTIRALRDNTAGTRLCTTLFALRKRFNLLCCKDSASRAQNQIYLILPRRSLSKRRSRKDSASNQHMQINLHVLIAEPLKSLGSGVGGGAWGVGQRGVGQRANGRAAKNSGHSRLPIPYNFGLFLWRSESRRVFLAKLASTAAVKSTPV